MWRLALAVLWVCSLGTYQFIASYLQLPRGLFCFLRLTQRRVVAGREVFRHRVVIQQDEVIAVTASFP